MSARRTPRREARQTGRQTARSRRAGLPWGRLALGVTALLVVAAAWIALRPGGTVSPRGELPGPLGGVNISQDVNTLVGRPAPSFTLSDAEGTTYTVTPGQGKPLVLFTHMGIT